MQTAAKSPTPEKNDASTSLLVEKVIALQRQIGSDNSLPRPDGVISLAVDLANALEQMQDQVDSLKRENQAVVKRNEALEQHNRVVNQQNYALQRETRLLGQRFTDIERQSAIVEAERKRYRDLFEFAPDAYLITDAQGKILEGNQASIELLNLRPREINGQQLHSFVVAKDQKLFSTIISRVARVQDMELGLQPRNLPAFDASITLSTVYDESGHPVRLRWLLRDVTERHRALAALDASERRFRAIFNEADMGIVLVDMQDKISRANPSFQKMLGYTEEELYGKFFDELTTPEDLPATQAASRAIREGIQNRVRIEKRFHHKDGRIIWASIILSLLPNEDGVPRYTMRLIENITAEKQAAAELAEMRRRLLESGEVERLRLAQELHDGPMQDLYGTVFRLSNFHEQTCDPIMKTNLEEAQGILRGVAGTLRTICGELRPPTLSNLGLERAIRSHAERIQDNHPELDMHLHLSNGGQELTAHTRLAFFRIYQQCMANVLHHAQASQMMVAFHIGEQELTLDVWDNGKGFTLPERWVDLLRQGHYGLASIAERVQALGGTLKIETHPGAGTLIHVTAPKDMNVLS